MQPTWNRSSAFSPRLLKRCTTLSTNRRLPRINSSRAAWLPPCTRGNSSRILSLVNTGSAEVSTPQISTLLVAILRYLRQNQYGTGGRLCAGEKENSLFHGTGSDTKSGIVYAARRFFRISSAQPLASASSIQTGDMLSPVVGTRLLTMVPPL